MAERPALRDYSRSRAVLIGTWEYAFLNGVPAAEHSMRRMAGLLTGPLCGWPQDRVLLAENERSPGDLPDRLITAFDGASDVALFYFVGHGQISPDDQLCLGLVHSRPDANRRTATSLRFSDVRQALRDSNAAVKIVILDCCFAGLATTGTLAGLAGDVLDLTAGTGAYTMAATSAYATAWYEHDRGLERPQTYFTKYLADLVEEGIPGQPALLRMNPLFRRLRDNLAVDGRPVPQSRAVNDAREFVFAYNAAPLKAQRDPEQELALLGQRFESLKAATEAQVDALKAEAAHREQELARLRELLASPGSRDAGQQRELQDAVDEAARQLDDTREMLRPHGDPVAQTISARSDSTRLAGTPGSGVALEQLGGAVKSGLLSFRLVATGKFQRVSVERAAEVESPAGEHLVARRVWLGDGIGGGRELRLHMPVRGERRSDGYARLKKETLAGRLLHRATAGREYPRELSRLYGDESISADPFALFEPYRGELLRDIGAYLSDDFEQFMAGLLTGLYWLAEAGIAHRSIGLDTVLWDKATGQVQITDFSRSALFGTDRTPLTGGARWIAPESRPDTYYGAIGPTDDVWSAVRLLYYARSGGQLLTNRRQLVDFGLAEAFNGMLDMVIGPPEGRPTARDLIVDGLGRPHLLPGVVDSRKSLIAGRAEFLNARERKYPDGQGLSVPDRFWDDLVWPPLSRKATGTHGDPR
jgi:hypothetical protein